MTESERISIEIDAEGNIVIRNPKLAKAVREALASGQLDALADQVPGNILCTNNQCQPS